MGVEVSDEIYTAGIKVDQMKRRHCKGASLYPEQLQIIAVFLNKIFVNSDKGFPLFKNRNIDFT